MTDRARTEYRYEKLTWPEINDAVDLRKVCIVPCGAVEQHGPHLPLDVDLVCPCGIADGAGRSAAEDILVLPIVSYGYTGHVSLVAQGLETAETTRQQRVDVYTWMIGGKLQLRARGVSPPVGHRDDPRP